MDITKISKLENGFEKFITLYAENPIDIVLYGAGEGADWAINLLETKNIQPAAIVDKSRGGAKRNIPIMTYADLVELYNKKTVYILISSPKYEEEIYDLLKANFDEKYIFSFECELYYHYIHDISGYREYILNKASEFMDIYNKLGDDLSRLTLENVLKGRISGELKYFKESYVDNQYFAKDIVKLGNNEVFLDVGAYIGDTVEEIVKMTGENYKKIYCFEPDKKCIASLKESIEKYENVEIIEKGAWNKHEKLFIQEDSGHGASSINEVGEYEIELDCIDNCIEESERVTHIKMDIEGAELAALQGAKRIIQEYRPKLAICVYHKNEDILDISDFILSIVPEYKLFLRHHNISGTETVLYAICD